ncbi:MAG: hypothetical protein A3J62_03465 [Candidatus Buchananbacteria bacterium RIFCSPHIGHO2_02_FULL_38_8]|uniref:Hemerythrin-like domain-containing protein n=2 Tax=Candidatus Buchananiibacteriota TaxID=1817903 RepID=A0A1G1XT48_9BACT|nr:MAG: hypothetical protein A2731_03555 [Candidatus Buchananbacteria bacterium RIFCSPHIGHO2_01_FULL_39_8]OGY47222.1 MAG: hypothetical protein A3J62_03465 [Candidatus Buchananbacteria bacterium RIFCSPHIGHO2_02_FULL_38_8]
MEKPTKILSDEHQNILKIINTLTKECTNLKSGKQLDKDFFTTAIDFIRNYADKFHHAKEEDILFVELSKDTVKMICNPTQQMLYEHDLGRNFVKGMEESLRDNNKDSLIQNTLGYTQLLQDHIYKEDNILYPMAEQALDQQTQETMAIKFREFGSKNPAQQAKYLKIVEEFINRK